MTRNCLGEISASLLAFCAGLAPVVDTRWTRRACRGSDGAEWRLGRRSRCRALRSGPAAEQALPPFEERGDARTCVPVDATRECPALTNHPWQSEGFLHSSPKSAGCDTFASCWCSALCSETRATKLLRTRAPVDLVPACPQSLPGKKTRAASGCTARHKALNAVVQVPKRPRIHQRVG